MTMTVEPTVDWSQDQMLEVVLNEPDDFLKVRETLTRIGVASRKEKSCLHLMENMLTLLLTMFNVEIVSLVFLQIGD